MPWSCLPGRLRDDVDAAFERIAFVDEREVGSAAAEELGEHLAEVHADLFEGLGEELLRGVVDLARSRRAALCARR